MTALVKTALCTHPGCKALVRGGTRCDVHMHQQQQEKASQRRLADRHRLPANLRGYDNKWRKRRNAFLDRNPVCVACQSQGRVVCATVVDHIIPVTGPKDQSFYNESNWQALCHRCHSIKTASEDGGFGNGKQSGRAQNLLTGGQNTECQPLIFSAEGFARGVSR